MSRKVFCTVMKCESRHKPLLCDTPIAGLLLLLLQCIIANQTRGGRYKAVIVTTITGIWPFLSCQVARCTEWNSLAPTRILNPHLIDRPCWIPSVMTDQGSDSEVSAFFYFPPFNL